MHAEREQDRPDPDREQAHQAEQRLLQQGSRDGRADRDQDEQDHADPGQGVDDHERFLSGGLGTPAKASRLTSAARAAESSLRPAARARLLTAWGVMSRRAAASVWLSPLSSRSKSSQPSSDRRSRRCNSRSSIACRVAPSGVRLESLTIATPEGRFFAASTAWRALKTDVPPDSVT